MRPRRRYLKGNAGTEAPTSLFFFDSESISNNLPGSMPGKELTLKLWTACYVRREGRTFREPIWHRGFDAESFWAVIEQHLDWRRPLWMFAHNLGHDLTQLRFWDELEAGRFTPGPCPRPDNPLTGLPRPPWRGRMCLESRPTFLVLRGRWGAVKMVDSTNYWPTALGSIGERLRLPKLQIPADDADDSAWFTYCERDTKILQAAVCELIDWWLKESCGTFQVTAPMLAHTNWRHTTKCRAKEGKETSLVLEDDSPARPAERKATYGGRVEPFYLGTHDGPVYHLDCNSLYPYVMTWGLFPRARVDSPGACNLSQLSDWLEAYGAVALVLVDTGRSGDTYPVRANGVQCHATGKFVTWLCGAELRRAVISEHVREVFDCHLYSLAPLFQDWAATWLERRAAARRDGDFGHEEFCKLILNSLAGKFAQKGDIWKDSDEGPIRKGWGRTIELDYGTKQLTEWRWIAGHTQKRQKGSEPLNAFPAIFGFVTSQAREYMKQVFALLPRRSLLYTATDSIICTLPAVRALKRSNLLHPTQPGKFKRLGRYNEVEIHGPNWYRLDEEWTVSGFYGKAQRGPDGYFYADVWERLATQLNTNPDGKCGFVTQRLKELVATQKNDADSDGFRRPYRFTSDHEFTDEAPPKAHPFFME